MLHAVIRERESGKYLAHLDERGATFVSERICALRYDDREQADGVARALPFACDTIVMSTEDGHA